MEARQKITDKQMAALHVAYREYARQLSEQGYDLQSALKKTTLSVPIVEENFKECFARAALQMLYPKIKSHADLYSDQVETLFDSLNHAMSVRFNISIPFPEEKECK